MRKIIQNILVGLIKGYQNISPHLWQGTLVVSGCRFYPTCSEYAVRAIREHGPVKGAGMGIIRILKCNPLS